MTVCVQVDLSRLILGRELSFPVHSSSGLLLVGAGTPFTVELRDKLFARGIHKALMREEDAARLSMDALPDDEEEELVSVESALNQRIEEFISQGGMQVQNAGPAVSQRVVRHGTAAYSAQQQLAAQQELKASNAKVSTMIGDVANGNAVKVADLESVAGSCIELLAGDFANALSVTFAESGKQSLADHALKMATLGMALGVEMGFDFKNVRTVGIAGLLADLGMARVPDRILSASHRLSDVEFVSVQKHVIQSANLVERMQGIPTIVSVIVYQVHENADGSGYPRGRTIKTIHPFARVLHVADAYSAMTSDRPDRPRMMPYAAMECLLKQAKHGKVDAEVVRALLRCLSVCPIGSHVVLSDSSTARVLRANGDKFMTPVVRRLTTVDGTRIPKTDPRAMVDLAASELTIVQALPDPKHNEIAVDVRSDAAMALVGANHDASGRSTGSRSRGRSRQSPSASCAR